MKNGLVDMHTHSIMSDGTMTPSELVEAAKNSGVTTLALTDHDTVSGCAEAENACRNLGIRFVSGVEISCEGNSKLHILGYGLDYSAPELIIALDSLADERKLCAQKVCKELERFGVKTDYDEVLQIAGGGSVGKPHIAELMIRKGYVSSIQEGFERYLNHPDIKSIEKKKLPPAEAVDLIHRCGGLAVLAHPYQMKLEKDKLHRFIEKLAASGLDGIECWYTRYTEEMVDEYTGLCEKLNLYTTVGSDFHGDRKPGVLPGTGADNSLVRLQEYREFDGRILEKMK